MLQALTLPHTLDFPLPALRRTPLASRTRTRAWHHGAKGRTEAQLLALYIAGWAEADPRKIAEASAADYAFEDAFVGRFCRHSLAEYFDILRSRFAATGPTARKDLVFALRGPMDSASGGRTGQYWREFSREAPCLGLTGRTRIAVTPRGVIAEAVTYDLNMASDALRGLAG